MCHEAIHTHQLGSSETTVIVLLEDECEGAANLVDICEGDICVRYTTIQRLDHQKEIER